MPRPDTSFEHSMRRSLKAFLRHRSKDQPTKTRCTRCGSICMQLPTQFWLYGDEETFSIPLSFCPRCNPELLSQAALVIDRVRKDKRLFE